MVIDEPNYEHFIGQEYSALDGQLVVEGSYVGWMWSLQIWATPLTDVSFDITNSLECPNGCTVCPVGGCSEHAGKCLNNCDIDEYIDFDNDNSCGECLETCPNGCVRPENCNLCSDDECLDCTGFQEDACETCIPNAEVIDGECQCTTPYFYVI
jgi:hypothetical protein